VTAAAVSAGRFLGAACMLTALAVLLGAVGLRPRRLTGSVLALTPGATLTTTISSSATSAIPAHLSLGVQRYLVYTVSNPLDVPIVVSSLGLADVSAPAGCPATNLDLSRTSFSGPMVVAANGTNEAEVPISLLDTTTNQDACENATFGFTYSGAATYEQTGNGGGSGPNGVPTTTTPVPSSANVSRVAGTDRILTAIAASQDSFGDGLAAAVVITRSDLYPDALAGTPLAVREQAPLLLTPPTSLDPRTEAELNRVLAKGRIVYVLGGSAAISPAIARSIARDGYPVVRLAGPNRFATAVAIAAYLGPPNDILLTTGDSPADALAGGPAAAELGGVVVLTDGDRLPPETAAYLASETGVADFALGGPAAAADPSATPLVGADRYATSVAVAERFFPSPTIVGFANGYAFADALSGSVDISEKGGPLILVAPDGLPASVSNYLESIEATVTIGIVYGGTAVVPTSESDEIALVLHGR